MLHTHYFVSGFRGQLQPGILFDVRGYGDSQPAREFLQLRYGEPLFHRVAQRRIRLTEQQEPDEWSCHCEVQCVVKRGDQDGSGYSLGRERLPRAHDYFQLARDAKLVEWFS